MKWPTRTGIGRQEMRNSGPDQSSDTLQEVSLDMERPSVTVIIPVRNGANTIERAINSCLAQELTDIEVLVVDNQSSDSTKQIVKRYTDERVRYIYCGTPGRSLARNHGIEASLGRYLVFLDADDELPSTALNGHLKALASSRRAAASQGSTQYVSDKRTIAVVAPKPAEKFMDHLHVRNTIPINSIMIERTMVASFPVGIEHCEDWSFWLDSLATAEVVTHRDVVATVHRHEANTSGDRVTMKINELPIYIAHRGRRLPLGLTLRRFAHMTSGLIVYADAPKSRRVELALSESKWMRFVVTVLRKSPRIRQPFRWAVRMVFKC